MLIPTLAYLNLFLLTLAVSGLTYWSLGGRHSFCFGDDAVFNEGLCAVFNEPIFSVGIVLSLAWSTAVAFLCYFRDNRDLSLFLIRKFRYAIAIALCLVLISPFRLAMCLGFLGCQTIYFFPYALSIAFGIILFVLIFGRLSYKKSPESPGNNSFKNVVGVMMAVGFLGVSVWWVAIIHFAQQDTTFHNPQASKNSIDYSHYSENVTSDSLFLIGYQDQVTINVINNTGEIRPERLHSVLDYGHTDKVYSEARDYFIEDGIVYAGLIEQPPFVYRINAKKTDLIYLGLLSNRQIQYSIPLLPVVQGDTVEIPITIEEGRIFVGKIRYLDHSLSTRSVGDVSWVDTYSPGRQTLQVITREILRSNLENIRKLDLVNSIQSDPSDFSAIAYRLEYFLEITAKDSDPAIVNSRELAAAAIIAARLQNTQSR